jgi:hypothetical protein
MFRLHLRRVYCLTRGHATCWTYRTIASIRFCLLIPHHQHHFLPVHKPAAPGENLHQGFDAVIDARFRFDAARGNTASELIGVICRVNKYRRRRSSAAFEMMPVLPLGFNAKHLSLIGAVSVVLLFHDAFIYPSFQPDRADPFDSRKRRRSNLENPAFSENDFARAIRAANLLGGTCEIKRRHGIGDGRWALGENAATTPQHQENKTKNRPIEQNPKNFPSSI